MTLLGVPVQRRQYYTKVVMRPNVYLTRIVSAAMWWRWKVKCRSWPGTVQFLKVEKDLDERVIMCREFQTVGAATGKTREEAIGPAVELHGAPNQTTWPQQSNGMSHAWLCFTLMMHSLCLKQSQLFLCTLHTSARSDSSVLPQIGLSRILNVDLNDDDWLQASLPVNNGGLGIRSVTMLVLLLSFWPLLYLNSLFKMPL